MKKFCTKCGHEFEAVGREVICPQCKAQAAEDAKRAAVLKAKRASWNGESVPVRISGRASTLIREYGKAHNLPFAESLDALLKSTAFFTSLGVEWATVQPYKSRRRDKHATEDATEDAPQGKPQDAQEVKPQEVKQDGKQDAPQAVQAAKTSKASTAKKTASKTSTSKKGGKE